MQILTDEEWCRLKAALDAVRSGTGHPFPEMRRTVEAVVWRQRNGAKWRSLPPELGPWWKAAQLHIRWSRTGIWQRAFEWLRQAGCPDVAEVFLDGSSVRAHHKAAGAKGGNGPMASDARAAAGAARSVPRATPADDRSPSCCSPAKPAN